MSSYDSVVERVVEAKGKYPDEKAFYIICVRDKSVLPETLRNLEYKTFRGMPVAYVGITSSLKGRRHFNGTARNSTLRKSLGNILGLERHIYDDKKYKFASKDEAVLSSWIETHLLMYYSTETVELDEIESYLISRFEPPLNLDKNSSTSNRDFRRKLSELRK